MKIIGLLDLNTRDEATGGINAIIETPRGSRNKFDYDPKTDLFHLKKVLPAGAVFPYEFGFIPSTLGEDGDPLDVLILMDEPGFPGTLLQVRLVGVIEAEQTEDGKTIRNDRLIAVSNVCQDYRNVNEIGDLSDDLVRQIEHFFISYNQAEGRKFKPIGRPGSKEAKKTMETGERRYKQQQSADK